MRGRFFKPLICAISLILALMGCVQTKDYSTSSPSTEKNPQAAMYNTQLGLAYLEEGDLSRAKMKLLLAQTQDPNSSTVMGAWAYFYDTTGNNTDAKTYYLKAIKLDPNSGSALNNYGVFLCKNAQYAISINYFKKAIAEPNYLKTASTYENAGICAEKIPNVDQAEQFFVLALKNDPNLPTATLELAEINFKKGNILVASAYLKRYNLLARPTAESLGLDLQIARAQNDTQRVAADLLSLKQNFS